MVLFVVVQSLSQVWLFVTLWTAACQASRSFTISRSLRKLISIESMMPSNHLILCHPVLLLPSIFPSIRVFSNELALWIRWLKELKLQPKHQSLQWIFRIDWFDWNPQFSSVQSFSCVQLFATPWTAAHQASLSITNSQSLLKLKSTESVMPSNHLILCHPVLLLPSIFPSIRVFSSVSVLHIGAKVLKLPLQHQSFQWILGTDFL